MANRQNPHRTRPVASAAGATATPATAGVGKFGKLGFVVLGALVVLGLVSYSSPTFMWSFIITTLVVAVALPVAITIINGSSLPAAPMELGGTLWKTLVAHLKIFWWAVAIVWLFGFGGLFNLIFSPREFVANLYEEGVSIVGRQATEGDQIEYDRHGRLDLAAGNVSLTNQYGYYNFYLNPLAKSTDDMLVYRGDDRVKKGCGGLTEEFVRDGRGTEGSLQWGGDTVSRNGRMTHVFPHVITCVAYIDGQRVNLIYPGNSDPSLNGNGLSGDKLYDTVRSIVTDTQSMQQAGEDVCNQFYGSPTGTPVFAAREWKEVWSPRPDWELQPDPNQADVVEWAFSSSAVGGRFPMEKLHDIGKPKKYWVRLKSGGTKQVPAHFRYVPWGDCR